MPEQLTPRQQQVLDAYNSGMTVKQAAERIGLSPSRVSVIRRQIRDKGYNVRMRKGVCLFRKAGVGIGVMSDPLRELDPEIKRWVIDSMPEGSTLAEFAIACVRDAYFEEYPDG